MVVFSFVESATLVEGDPKAPFSIATTPRCRRYSIPWIPLLAPFDLMSRIFAKGSGGPGFIPKTQKMVLDATLLNTQYYKVRIKGKV